jgi:hypothetical protein
MYLDSISFAITLHLFELTVPRVYYIHLKTHHGCEKTSTVAALQPLQSSKPDAVNKPTAQQARCISCRLHLPWYAR